MGAVVMGTVGVRVTVPVPRSPTAILRWLWMDSSMLRCSWAMAVNEEGEEATTPPRPPLEAADCWRVRA